MTGETSSLYSALAARDRRFDGLFFVGVTTTGIYCRPICPAKTPGKDRCRFFERAAQAEREGFRPCLRCRPELAPGTSSVDALSRLARAAALRIEAGALNDGSLDDLAAELGVSARQLRRAVGTELGASPVQLAQTARLLLAKQLLTDTALPVTQVAFASGFASVRRFNGLFLRRYGLAPSGMRRRGRGSPMPGVVSLRLAFRAPFAWDRHLAFLAGRAVPGVERIEEGAYARTLRIDDHRGWFRARLAPGGGAVELEVSTGLAPRLMAVTAKVKDLFDLRARIDRIEEHFGDDEILAPLVKARPGLRVPGSVDGFELGLRAILGQQVTVRAATTLAGRFADAFGDPIETDEAGLHRLTPTAERIAAASPGELARLGIPEARAKAILALAGALASGSLRLGAGLDADEVHAALCALPGIGPWTASYIALRALSWPDAFPAGDLVLRKRLGGVDARAAEARAEPWRPFRAYAVLHLWNAASAPEAKGDSR